jgi:hypothetical protein
VGIRHRSRVGKFLLGSSVQHILLDAGCPVLTVKAREGGAPGRRIVDQSVVCGCGFWGAAVAQTLQAHGEIVQALTEGTDDPAEVVCVGLATSVVPEDLDRGGRSSGHIVR